MDDSASRRKVPQTRREPPLRRRSWCCPFTVPPRSPENPAHSRPKPAKKPETPSKSANSFPNSPQSSTKLGFVSRIDRRRMLSPGRVSPIDSEVTTISDYSIQEEELAVSVPLPVAPARNVQSRSNCLEKMLPPAAATAVAEASRVSINADEKEEEESSFGIFDVRMNLKEKYGGGSLVLELNSEVLCANSSVFAGLISDYRKESGGSAAKLCRIEVPEVDNLSVFRETIELMFEEDIPKRLLKIGVFRSIDILEVSAGIMFTNGIFSSLTYLEAVPWSEEEEDKLRGLFNRLKFDDSTTSDIFARLYSLDSAVAIDSQQSLARKLVSSITACNNANPRNELKSLVKGLLCKSSVYEKDYPDLNKEDLYAVCQSSIDSLVNLYEGEKMEKMEIEKPMIAHISKHVDNINWVFEIMLDRQMAEDFVLMWADQKRLLTLHGNASPMLRYELSRISATLFVAMGTRKVHCRAEARLGLLESWFGPMLLDFGWLQRCKKGLDMRTLEDAMGQALLTLPLKDQYGLFMEWFRHFSKHATECPNLSKAFQIWWRRAFVRGGSESHAVECR